MKRYIFVFLLCLVSIYGKAQMLIDTNDFLSKSSGLKYKITKKGNSKFAKTGDRIWVHYVGKLPNDSIFESTQKTGEQSFYLGYGQLIKAWDEGLRLVSEGGVIELLAPPKLAYGNEGYKGLNPKSNLFFKIALLQIDEKEAVKPYDIKGLKQYKTKDKIKYYIVKKGKGENLKSGDNAYVHYTGYFTNDSIFDTSIKKGKPVRITVGGKHVFKGWSMCLKQMNEGSKYRFIIPYKLAYGKKGYKNIIPPKATLIMDMELVKIVREIKVKKWNAENRDTIKTKSGLKYIVFKKGEGEQIKDNSVVEFHYSGYFTNGKLFDSSEKRQEPMKIPIGINAIIKGWDEGLKLMSKGAEYQLIIPSKLAYGKDGIPNKIPPNTDLIFDIKVLDVVF